MVFLRTLRNAATRLQVYLDTKPFVVFLPRTLHTNSIYNFCTFVLSNFILDLTVQLLLNAHTTHSYSRTHVLPL